MGELTSQGFEAESFDIGDSIVVGRRVIVILDKMDDILDGEHADEARFLAVPEWGRYDTWRGEIRTCN